ncbi:MAG: hypothetical protein R3Y46_03030 [Opitutales bacterium]
MKSLLYLLSLTLTLFNLSSYAGQAGLSDRCLASLSKATNNEGKYFGAEYELKNGKKYLQLMSIDENLKENIAYDLLNKFSHKATKLDGTKYRYIPSPSGDSFVADLIENAISQEIPFDISSKQISLSKLAMNMNTTSSNYPSFLNNCPISINIFFYPKQETTRALESVKYILTPHVEAEHTDTYKYIKEALVEHKVGKFREDKTYVGLIRTKDGEILSLDLIAIEMGICRSSILRLGEELGDFFSFDIRTNYAETNFGVTGYIASSNKIHSFNFTRIAVKGKYDLSGLRLFGYFKDTLGVFNTIFTLAPPDKAEDTL